MSYDSGGKDGSVRHQSVFRGYFRFIGVAVVFTSLCYSGPTLIIFVVKQVTFYMYFKYIFSMYVCISYICV